MNEKESMTHKMTRKAINSLIRRTYDGWPPYTVASCYQPRRPDKPLNSPSDKPNT